MKYSIVMLGAFPFPSPQGSQVFTRQMARRLAEAGHDVDLLTYGQGHAVQGEGYRHHRIRRMPGDDASRSGPSLVKPVLDGLLAARLARMLRRRRVDLVHAHNYEAAVVALAVRAVTGVPVVYHSHNLMADELPTYFEAGPSRALATVVGGLLDRHVPRRADRTIALCGPSAERLRQAGVEPSRLAVIPAAIDDDGELESCAPARPRRGVGEDAVVVADAGNHHGYQNLSLLLAAFEREPLVRCGARLLVATHDRDGAFDRELVERGLGGRVTVMEAREYARVREIMAAADVLVLPRRFGSGYPVKLLNYMCGARAVVAAGCGAKVLTDGVDGVLVDDEDPSALAAALDDLRREPGRRTELARAARATFVAGLSWDSVLPRIEAIYAGLVPGRSGRGSGS